MGESCGNWDEDTIMLEFFLGMGQRGVWGFHAFLSAWVSWRGFHDGFHYLLLPPPGVTGSAKGADCVHKASAT